MNPAAVILFALAGAATGAAQGLMLRRNVELWLGGGSSLAAFGLHLGRLALTVAVLAAAAFSGWPALLGCAGGRLAARAFVIRKAWSAGP
jgi:hypothetical protein